MHGFVQYGANQCKIAVFGAVGTSQSADNVHYEITAHMVQEYPFELGQSAQTADVVFNTFLFTSLLFNPSDGCFLPQPVGFLPQVLLLP